MYSCQLIPMTYIFAWQLNNQNLTGLHVSAASYYHVFIIMSCIYIFVLSVLLSRISFMFPTAGTQGQL